MPENPRSRSNRASDVQLATVVGDLTRDDCAALLDWINQQDPSDEDGLRSVQRQGAFARRLCETLEAHTTHASEGAAFLAHLMGPIDLAIILASIRTFQRIPIEAQCVMDHFDQFAPDVVVASVGDDALDDLCERINLSDGSMQRHLATFVASDGANAVIDWLASAIACVARDQSRALSDVERRLTQIAEEIAEAEG